MTRRRHIVRGHLTRVNLAAAQAVFAPPVKDAWGRALPPFDPDLARLCAELSAATYDLEVERFFDARWVDCTFQAENRLFDAIDGPVDRPVRAPVPGQAAVCYVGGEVVCAGTICAEK